MSDSPEDLRRQIAALRQQVDNLTRMNGIFRKLVLSLSKSNAVSTAPNRTGEPDKRMLH